MLNSFIVFFFPFEEILSYLTPKQNYNFGSQLCIMIIIEKSIKWDIVRVEKCNFP